MKRGRASCGELAIRNIETATEASRILLPFPTGAFIPHYARFIVSRTKDDSPWRVLVSGAQTGTSISDFMNE